MPPDAREIVVSAGALRIAWTWRDDRFQHVVGVQAGGEFLPLLVSREGTCHDDWPASPPLQQLHQERSADGEPVAFFVGLAGQSHWSLSVAFDSALRQATFDAACRVKSRPTRLGSMYALAPGLILHDDTPTRWIGELAEWRVRLTTLPEGMSIADGPGEWRVSPADEPATFPSTFRWKYTIGIEPR